MNPQTLLLGLLAAASAAACVWVFAPVFRGAQAARRHLGTHRLVLGTLVAILAANVLLSLPVVGKVNVDALDARTFLLIVLVTQIPMFLVIFVRLVFPAAATWSELGLRMLPINRLLRVGIATAVVAMALVAILSLGLGQVGVRQEQLRLFEFIPGASTMEFLAVLLLAAVVAPFVEELYFRGFVFGFYRRRKSRLMAYGASSALFALVHANQVPADFGQVLALFVPVFALGWLLAWTYARTGSLLPGMLAHGINNAVALAAVRASGSA